MWALQHRKHVLCEKPLALSTNEVDVIATAATAEGVIVMEALMYRFHPQTQRVVGAREIRGIGDAAVGLDDF